MAVARRKVSRTNRKPTSKTASVAPRRKPAARVPAAMGEERIIRTLQQGLFDTLSGSEGEGRSPISVSAAFVQSFLQLTQVQAIAVYVRDEQTREMTCLAEAGSSDASVAGKWREGLARAEQNAQMEQRRLVWFVQRRWARPTRHGAVGRARLASLKCPFAPADGMLKSLVGKAAFRPDGTLT